MIQFGARRGVADRKKVLQSDRDLGENSFIPLLDRVQVITEKQLPAWYEAIFSQISI
jgi:hypothetical protein